MIRTRVREYLDHCGTPTEKQSAEIKRLLDDANQEEVVQLSGTFPAEFDEWMHEWQNSERPIPGTCYIIGDMIRHDESGTLGTIIGPAASGTGVSVKWNQSSKAAFPIPSDVDLASITDATVKIGDYALVTPKTLAAERLSGAMVQVIDFYETIDDVPNWTVRLCKGYEHQWIKQEFTLPETSFVVIPPPAVSPEVLADARSTLEEMRRDLRGEV